MVRICAALLAYVMLIVGLLVVRTHRANREVDTVGRYLANWANHHQTSVRINHKPVQIVDSVVVATGPDFCRVSSHIAWQSDAATESDNQRVRDNLARLIKESACNANDLLIYLRSFDETGAIGQVGRDKLATDLGCLGSLVFDSVGE